jgi:hypothetical protein
VNTITLRGAIGASPDFGSRHARSLAQHYEKAERGKLHSFAMFKTVGHFLGHKVHQRLPTPSATNRSS